MQKAWGLLAARQGLREQAGSTLVEQPLGISDEAGAGSYRLWLELHSSTLGGYT